MQLSRISRARKSALVAAAAVTLIAGPSAIPAAADDARGSVGVLGPDEVGVEVGATASVPLTVEVKAEQPGATTVQSPYVYVSAGMAGRAPEVEIDLPAPCRKDGDPQHWTCRWDSLPVGKTALTMNIKSIVKDPNAYRALMSINSGTRNGGQTNYKSMAVNHLRPVDLAVLGGETPVKTTPGATFVQPMGFQNVRDQPIKGVSLVIDTQYGLEAAKKYGNCRYGSAGDTNAVICDFDVSVKPGESFKLGEAYPFKVAQDIPHFGSQASYRFIRTSEVVKLGWRDPVVFTPGQGAALSLVATTAKAPDKYRNGGSFNLEIETQRSRVTTPPLAVVASPDTETPVRVVVKNEGPGALNTMRVEDPFNVGAVAFPRGVQVTAAPKECVKDGMVTGIPEAEPFKAAGAALYGCALPDDDLWKAGTTREFVFRVKLAKDVNSARGAVLLVQNDSNTVTELLFTAKEGATSGGSAATGGAGATGGGNGTELANTGSDSSSTTLIIGGAVALFALGGGAFLVVRRRRNAGLAA